MDQRFPFFPLFCSIFQLDFSFYPLISVPWSEERMRGCFGAKAHFHCSLFLIRCFSTKLLCSSLSSALDCILSLFFLSSAQDSIFLSSSHLPVKPAHLHFLCACLETRPGGFSVPNCQALIAFCCSGRHNSPANRGHLDRWSD